MIAPERAGILVCAISYFYKRCTLGRAGILVCAFEHAKTVAFSESHEIAWVPYLGQITNIRSGRVQKLKKEHSRVSRDMGMRDCACEKGCCLKIAQNLTGSILRPNNEYWKRSRGKIIKRVLLRGPRY